MSKKPRKKRKKEKIMAKSKRRVNGETYPAKIKVVGIGGGGGNAVTRMNSDFPRSIELIAINTDIQDLNYCEAKKKIHIGKNLTRGLGTGMNIEIGRQAAEENRSEIVEGLKGADIVFVTACLGGGTGTAGAPVVAEVARELGALTVAVVTKPFTFEGTQRSRIAAEGLMRLKDKVDALIVIPNDRIFSLIDKDTSLNRAFEEIDEVLKNSVLGITDLIMTPGIVNIDFADVKAIMQDAGSSVIGIGSATGGERSVNAVNMAINSPLLEVSIDGAKGVLLGISGNRDLKMSEISEVAKLIAERVDSGAKIIFGAFNDRKLKKGQLKITLIATGFNGGGFNKSSNQFPSLFTPLEKETLSGFTPIQLPGDDENIKREVKKEEKLVEEKVVVLEHNPKKGKDDKKRADDVWDIPTFLRKKKR